jgi:glycosyltransferase involved in cell wall biosynthesis
MTAPLRVSLVADTEGWGGAETWLVHHLRRASAHHVLTSVVCAEEVVDGFRPWVPEERLVAVPLARHGEKAPATLAALEEQAPDVVLVNLVDPASNAATLDAALTVAPTAGVLHLVGDLGPEPAALAARYADLAVLLTPSQEGVELVRTRLAEPRGGIVVTCNGVDLPPDPCGPAGHHPPRIGGFGRLARQKGYDVLLDAVRLLVDRGVDLEVVLGGAGREEAALRRSATGLPVSFTGWVPDARAFLAGLDLFCLPSRHEAMPLALLEAMAEGLPCVATDVGDVGSRLGDAVALVPPEDPRALADAVQGLLEDGSRAGALGRSARARVQRGHDAAAMAAATFSLLRGVVAQAAATFS